MTDSVQQIGYGMFIMPFYSSDKLLAHGYNEDLELVVLTQERGDPELWISQMA